MTRSHILDIRNVMTYSDILDAKTYSDIEKDVTYSDILNDEVKYCDILNFKGTWEHSDTRKDMAYFDILGTKCYIHIFRKSK